MDEKFKEFTRKLHEILKPLGYRKEGVNYRIFGPDGLCRIINLQKNRWNTAVHCEFTLNIGVYFEKDEKITNRRFKEYDCQIRKRADERDLGGEKEWWLIDSATDLEELLEELLPMLHYIEEWFGHFPSKDETIAKILDGSAQQYSDTNIMHNDTKKLLEEIAGSI